MLSTQRDSSRRERVGLGFHFLERLDDAEPDSSGAVELDQEESSTAGNVPD